MNEKEIARIAHEVTRHYGRMMSQATGPAWKDTSQDTKDNALEAVQYHIATPIIDPSESPGRQYVFRAVVLALTNEDSQ